MEQNIINNQIRGFLDKNSFYTYKKSLPELSSRLVKEYREVADQKNKRNILLDKSWGEITSLKDPRQILVIELGGSYLHFFDVEISINNTVNVKREETIDFYEDKLYTPEVLFGDIMRNLDSFVDREKSSIRDCVFIFTFPIEQYKREDGYIDATAIKVNKKINHKDIVGMKVGKTFQEFLRTHGYENIKIAVTNDTVANLLAAKYLEIKEDQTFEAALNIIVGTGTNISVGYDITPDSEKKFYIINTEFGYFTFIPLSKFDQIFNDKCDSKDQSLAEKMISGLWQPQIFKIIIEELIKEKIIRPDTLDIFKKVPLNGGKIEGALRDNKFPPEFQDFLDYIWMEIRNRGAAICGMTIANIMSETLKNQNLDRINFAIIEVGGVLEKARGYKEKMYEALNEELTRLGYDKKISYNSFNPENASALGSAVLNTIIS